MWSVNQPRPAVAQVAVTDYARSYFACDPTAQPIAVDAASGLANSQSVNPTVNVSNKESSYVHHR
jgi:hypothetical protein